VIYCVIYTGYRREKQEMRTKCSCEEVLTTVWEGWVGGVNMPRRIFFFFFFKLKWVQGEYIQDVDTSCIQRLAVRSSALKSKERRM